MTIKKKCVIISVQNKGDRIMKYIVYFFYVRGGKLPPGRLKQWNAERRRKNYVYKYDKTTGTEKPLNAFRGTACIFNDCYLCYTLKCTEYSTAEKRVIVDERGLEELKNDPRIDIKRIIKEVQKNDS